MFVPIVFLAAAGLLACAAGVAVWHYTCPSWRSLMIRAIFSVIAGWVVFLGGITAVVWEVSGAAAGRALLSGIGMGVNIAGFAMALVCAAIAAHTYFTGTTEANRRAVRRDLAMTAAVVPLCTMALVGVVVFRATLLS